MKAALGDVERTDLPGETIEPAEQIAMYLPQAFYRADFDGVKKGTVKQGVCLGFAFPVDGFAAVGKPLDKPVGLFAWEVLGKLDNPVVVKRIRKVFFSVCGR